MHPVYVTCNKISLTTDLHFSTYSTSGNSFGGMKLFFDIRFVILLLVRDSIASSSVITKPFFIIYKSGGGCLLWVKLMS